MSKKVKKSTPLWAAVAIFACSTMILVVASWYPPSRPEYIIEPIKAAFFASLGFLMGYPVGSMFGYTRSFMD